MKYHVIYNSFTGNTEELAQHIQQVLGKEKCGVFGPAGKIVLSEGVVCAGFWTDKGSCTSEMADFLAHLENRQVFLFGTAGFGAKQEYYDQILERVQENLPENNQIIGQFMCQGRMPDRVRTRYEAMLKENPGDTQLQAMIANFDQALSHPSNTDLKKLTQILKNTVEPLLN